MSGPVVMATYCQNCFDPNPGALRKCPCCNLMICEHCWPSNLGPFEVETNEVEQ